MTKNMGTVDRWVRFLAATTIAILWFTGTIEGIVATVLALVAVAFFVTSAIGWCPLYVPFGLSTMRRRTGQTV